LVARAGSSGGNGVRARYGRSYEDFARFATVAGKPVHVRFDGGRLTSDAGILILAAVERRLGIAERLASCMEDPRDPERVRHELAEMIRYRALLIAAGYPDGNDCDALKSDPAFKMAVGRLPESGGDLCSQPTISRLENLSSATALKRMMAAMVELFCDSFDAVPRRILLDIDDTEDRVHGGQKLALWNAHYDSRCFPPIHIYEAASGKPVAVILRPGKTPDGAEVALVLRHVIGRIRARWPAVEIIVRSDSHYGRAAVMAWCERKGVGYIFGLGGNPVLRRRVCPLAEEAALGRLDGEGEKVRRYGEFRYAAKSWNVERRVIARVEAGPQGADSRFVVTNLPGLPKTLYERLYCARGQAENLIKAHKLRLASDRTSCSKATANQVRLLIHTGGLLAHAQPASPGAPQFLLAGGAVRHDPPLLDQGRCPGHRDGHPHRDLAADRLPLPGWLHRPRRPDRQSPAVAGGAVWPRNEPLGATSNPDPPRPRRHGTPRPHAAVTPRASRFRE
jgi:hypothetical protein